MTEQYAYKFREHPEINDGLIFLAFGEGVSEWWENHGHEATIVTWEQ